MGAIYKKLVAYEITANLKRTLLGNLIDLQLFNVSKTFRHRACPTNDDLALQID